MSMFHMLGLGDKRILTEGYCTEGRVTEVKTCHWLKVNTKPIRTNTMDGVRFPHIIRFTYCVDGTEYQGSRYVNWNARCHAKDEIITVCYDAKKPAKHAVMIL